MWCIRAIPTHHQASIIMVRKAFTPSLLIVAESFAVIPGGTNERFVQLGSELRLRCRISKTVRAGERPPSIKWFRNGTRVDDAHAAAAAAGGGGNVAVSPVNHKRVYKLVGWSPRCGLQPNFSHV